MRKERMVSRTCSPVCPLRIFRFFGSGMAAFLGAALGSSCARPKTGISNTAAMSNRMGGMLSHGLVDVNLSDITDIGVGYNLDAAKIDISQIVPLSCREPKGERRECPYTRFANGCKI